MWTLTAGDIRSRTPLERATLGARLELLEQLIKQADRKDPEFPDLLFRLAETYLDLAAAFEREAARLDEADEGHDVLVDQANHARGKATKAYRLIVTNPALARYVRMDEALFHYALELGAQGQEPGMKQALLRLIREFPTSPSIPYAYAMFGDVYLVKERLEEASKLYTKVTSMFPDSPVHLYASSKLAWCHLLQGQQGKAGALAQSLDEFSRVIELSKREERAQASVPRVVDDAQHGLVEAYVLAGDPREAWGFFERANHTSDELQASIERLALAYFRAKDYPESIFLHRELLRRHPDAPSGCEWQWRIFSSTLADDDGFAMLQERTQLQARYQRLEAVAPESPEFIRCRARVRDAQRVTLPVD